MWKNDRFGLQFDFFGIFNFENGKNGQSRLGYFLTDEVFVKWSDIYVGKIEIKRNNFFHPCSATPVTSIVIIFL
jgi:hypothetical protein